VLSRLAPARHQFAFFSISYTEPQTTWPTKRPWMSDGARGEISTGLPAVGLGVQYSEPDALIRRFKVLGRDEADQTGMTFQTG
jgi:hypothetical protein